jgi:hypothetical protein
VDVRHNAIYAQVHAGHGAARPVPLVAWCG